MTNDETLDESAKLFHRSHRHSRFDIPRSGITFLDFPKSGLRGTGFRDGLPHLVMPNDLNKL